MVDPRGQEGSEAGEERAGREVSVGGGAEEEEEIKEVGRGKVFMGL